MPAHYTATLAEYATSLRYEDLPTEVIEKAKQCLLDLLGIMVRAKYEADSSPAVERAVEALCPHAGPSTAIGARRGYPAQYAALLNGTYGHSLDFDDTHIRASLHPGAPVIPTILALAEEAGADGKRLLAALVAGYEVICRVSRAANPKGLYDRGFHPTVVAGVFGATAAGANLLGLDAAALVNAFGINNSQAAGSMQFLANGAWNKRIHVGFAAHNAIVALALARAGAVGAAFPLEGQYGFINGYGQNGNPELLVEGLGEHYEILETGIKPYPSCRFTHGGIDVIADLVRREGIRADDIARIRIGLCAKAIDIVGAPQEQKRRPQSVVDGQFSMHFTAAVAAATGGFGWTDYRYVGDPAINALMERIDVEQDAKAEAAYPDFLTLVRIETRDGRVFEGETDCIKGEPGNPLSWNDIVAKFDDLAAIGLDEAARAEIVDRVRNFEQTGDVAAFMRLFREAAAQRAIA